MPHRITQKDTKVFRHLSLKIRCSCWKSPDLPMLHLGGLNSHVAGRFSSNAFRLGQSSWHRCEKTAVVPGAIGDTVEERHPAPIDTCLTPLGIFSVYSVWGYPMFFFTNCCILWGFIGDSMGIDYIVSNTGIEFIPWAVTNNLEILPNAPTPLNPCFSGDHNSVHRISKHNWAFQNQHRPAPVAIRFTSI